MYFYVFYYFNTILEGVANGIVYYQKLFHSKNNSYISHSYIQAISIFPTGIECSCVLYFGRNIEMVCSSNIDCADFN